MARGRMISGTISESRKFAALNNHVHRLIYLMVLPHVDKAGRFEADPVLIKGKCLTRLDIDPTTVEAWLKDGVSTGLLRVYEANNMRVLEIVNFEEHNTPHYKEPDSRLPGPEAGTPCYTQNANVEPTLSQAQTNVEPTLTIIEVKESKEKERKDMSAQNADAPPNFDTLAEIWNTNCGNLRKVTDLEAARLNPELQKLTRSFLKRHGPRALDLFRAGIPAVRDDPHWLGRKAPKPTTNRAAYGIKNYLRNVEEKAEAATDMHTAPTSTPTPARPWEAWDIVQHKQTGIVATIHELLPDGKARVTDDQIWNLGECTRCNN